MKFAPVEKINIKPSQLPSGQLVSVTSEFLGKSRLPSLPLPRVRCYYWPADFTPQNTPLTLERALSRANTIDIMFESRAPEHMRSTLPKEAFAFQFLKPETSSFFNRAARVLGAAIKPKWIPEMDIYLVGDVGTGLDDKMVLKPTVGNYIQIEKSAAVLRPEDLRPHGSLTRAEALARYEITEERSGHDIPDFLRRPA